MIPVEHHDKSTKLNLLWYLMKPRGAKDAVAVEGHYSSLLRCQIFILHRLCCLWNWIPILELYKGIFCLRANKSLSRYIDFAAIADWLNIPHCHIAGVFPATARPLIGMVTWSYNETVSRQMPGAELWRQTGNSSELTAVARDQSVQLKVVWCCRRNLSAFFKICFFSFCYITNLRLGKHWDSRETKFTVPLQAYLQAQRSASESPLILIRKAKVAKLSFCMSPPMVPKLVHSSERFSSLELCHSKWPFFSRKIPTRKSARYFYANLRCCICTCFAAVTHAKYVCKLTSDTRTPTTTVSIICITITIQHCKSVEDMKIIVI